MHSNKFLGIQQGKSCYLGILCNPCSDDERWRVERASLSFPNTRFILGEMMEIVRVHCVFILHYTSAKFPEVNPVDACRGFPTELTPRG